MSDTPRTDALYCPEFGMLLHVDTAEGYEHACQLERELEAARPEEKALDQAHQDYRQELVDSLANMAAWFKKRGEIESSLICTRAAIEIDGTSAPSPRGTTMAQDIAKQIQDGAPGDSQANR